MKHINSLIILGTSILLFIACQKSSKNDAPTEIEKECYISIDTLDFSFGIEYDSLETYLIPGGQSNLSANTLATVVAAIGEVNQDIGGVLSVCNWVNQNFEFQNAGGSMIGVPTVDELFESKTFYGCHSAALIISSILRESDFPAVMIETAMVQWAYDFKSGATNSYAGHVMTEVFVDEKWVLLDNNCSYVADYDPLNPYINAIGGDAYFVYAKGIDTWAYTDRDDSFTHSQMIFFSENVYCFEDLFHTANYDWIN